MGTRKALVIILMIISVEYALSESSIFDLWEHEDTVIAAQRSMPSIINQRRPLQYNKPSKPSTPGTSNAPSKPSTGTSPSSPSGSGTSTKPGSGSSPSSPSGSGTSTKPGSSPSSNSPGTSTKPGSSPSSSSPGSNTGSLSDTSSSPGSSNNNAPTTTQTVEVQATVVSFAVAVSLSGRRRLQQTCGSQSQLDATGKSACAAAMSAASNDAGSVDCSYEVSCSAPSSKSVTMSTRTVRIAAPKLSRRLMQGNTVYVTVHITFVPKNPEMAAQAQQAALGFKDQVSSPSAGDDIFGSAFPGGVSIASAPTDSTTTVTQTVKKPAGSNKKPAASNKKPGSSSSSSSKKPTTSSSKKPSSSGSKKNNGTATKKPTGSKTKRPGSKKVTGKSKRIANSAYSTTTEMNNSSSDNSSTDTTSSDMSSSQSVQSDASATSDASFASVDEQQSSSTDDSSMNN